MGGQPTPALGFAIGLERLHMVMQAQGCEYPQDKPCEVYIAPMGDEASVMASSLCSRLRAEGFSAETDIVGRGLKAQMKYANKLGARFTVVLGDNEIAEGKARLKNMADGSESEVTLPEGLVAAVYDAAISNTLADLTDSLENDASGLLK